jgi:hypothetical protein
MKVLESFRCFVNLIRSGNAYCDLKSEKTGEHFIGTIEAETLAKRGIGERDAFYVRTVEIAPDTIQLQYEKIPPRVLTEQEIDAIKDRIKMDFPDFEDEDDY